MNEENTDSIIEKLKTKILDEQTIVFNGHKDNKKSFDYSQQKKENNQQSEKLNEVKDEREDEKEKPKRKITTFKYSQMGKGALYEAVFIEDGLPVFIKYNDQLN